MIHTQTALEAILDRLRSLRGPGGSYSDVILRLASESVV